MVAPNLDKPFLITSATVQRRYEMLLAEQDKFRRAVRIARLVSVVHVTCLGLEVFMGAVIAFWIFTHR